MTLPVADRQPMNCYLLPQHVYLCKTSQGLVFLNLKEDKYVGIGGPELSLLSYLVPDWPVPCELEHSHQVHARAQQIAEELCQAGLLTRHAESGKSARPEQVANGECAIEEIPASPCAYSSAVLVLYLALATLSVASTLKWRSLDHAIERVRSRRRATESTRERIDPVHVASLVQEFVRMRTLFYSARQKCLFNCLVLLEFLAYFRVFPTLVVGVTTFPFKAHSWLQAGRVVLTDSPESTAEYTPILVV
jgi:hypothetical protein